MGHERIGTLPKSERWKSIVNSISDYTDAEDTIVEIAAQTTKNVRKRFQDINTDAGVFGAFKFIITLSHFAKSDNALDRLAEEGIVLPKNFNLYDLAFCIQNYISQNEDSKEYSSFATQSIIETISDWARSHQTNQQSLFDSNDTGLEIWQQASNGAGFCELSRLFFSKFTERYLKYFLEREAASGIDNLYDRTQFNKNLETHIDRISKHAFETSKITQSFAAAWFNKYAKEKLPSNKRIKGFLSFAFQKINSELIREEIKYD
ncbi:hypothetical protein [Pedobacter africanus]|uniref:Uncharacterized protein n=1 Tax=Pedobacter africanus TaxID=151894 RepID=A0A1W2B552_9SPHI|nr:hypothetical protein [Pedobacter africanus]SMC67964.1 hypothetical protein SAMN04488524_1919 [Pedobacter africanus]